MKYRFSKAFIKAIICGWIFIVFPRPLSATPIPALGATSPIPIKAPKNPPEMGVYTSDINEPGALLAIEVYHIILMLSFEAFSDVDCQPPQRKTHVYGPIEQLDYEIMIVKSQGRKMDTLVLYFNAIQMRQYRLVHCQYSWKLVSGFIEYLDKVENIAKNPPYTMPEGSVKRSGLGGLEQGSVQSRAKALWKKIHDDRESLADSITWRIKQTERIHTKYTPDDYKEAVVYLLTWRSQQISHCEKGLKKSEKKEVWLARSRKAVEKAEASIQQLNDEVTAAVVQLGTGYTSLLHRNPAIDVALRALKAQIKELKKGIQAGEDGGKEASAETRKARGREGPSGAGKQA